MLKKLLAKIFHQEIQSLADKKSEDQLVNLKAELEHYKNVLPAYRSKLNEFKAVNSELHLIVAELNNKIKQNGTEPTSYTVH